MVRYGFLGTAGECGGRGLALCALCAAAALAAARASALAACWASCGVIQVSIGPRAVRHTLPWCPPGMITNGTFATLVCSSCLKFAAATTSGLSWAPAASQKAGSTSLMGTRVMYALGVFTSCKPGRPKNTLTRTGVAPGLLPAGTALGDGAKYPDSTPTAP